MQCRTWYLSEEAFESDSFRIPGVALQPQDLPLAQAILEQAKSTCDERYGGYRLTLANVHTGGELLVLRGHRIMTAHGALHALREIPRIVPKLIGSPFAYDALVQRSLLAPDLNNGGLVLVAGSAGTGKSTTMAAALVSRLETYGSMAITLEDPPEYAIQGLHKTGSCLQLAASGPDMFPSMIQDALRCYPAHLSGMMLMVSEVRSAETAALVLESALSGHLVITSIHAASVESAVTRLVSLASQVLGTSVARFDAADALRLVLHQRRKPQGGISFRLLKHSGEASVSTKIREGNFHMLSADVRDGAAS